MHVLRTARIATAVAAASLFAGAALAAGAGVNTTAMPGFDSLDINHDGALSRSELPAQLQDMRAHFRQYAVVGNRISRDGYNWYVSRVTTPPMMRTNATRPVGFHARALHQAPAPTPLRAQDGQRAAR